MTTLTIEDIDRKLKELSIAVESEGVKGYGKPERVMRIKIDDLLDMRNDITAGRIKAPKKKSKAGIPQLNAVPYGGRQCQEKE